MYFQIKYDNNSYHKPDYALTVRFSKLLMVLIGVIISVLLVPPYPMLAQTPPTATLSPREQIDRDATRILAGYTATAEAMPITAEQADDFTALAFGLGLCSMLIVAVPLGVGVWRLSRR